MDLQEIRNEIDRVDNDLLSLILQRKDLVAQVAEYKKDNEIPVFAPQREEEILHRMESRVGRDSVNGVGLIYGILMDFNKLHEYRQVPKEIQIPTRLGGASVRAILPDNSGALCRYLSPLAAAGVSISGIHSQVMPGGKMAVDIEVVGDTQDVNFAAALAVLADTAEKFMLL